MDPKDLEALVQRQQRRFPAAYSRAARITNVRHPQWGKALGLFQEAEKRADVTERLAFLQRATSAWAEPYLKQAACRKGCSHCCRIRLVISEHEADALQRATGRIKQQPAAAIILDPASPDLAKAHDEEALIAHYTGVPCPFLEQTSGTCTAYDARPLMCRMHMNLDRDNLLCQLSDPSRVNVPEPNSIPIAAGCLAVLGACRAADIREWFPAESAAKT